MPLRLATRTDGVSTVKHRRYPGEYPVWIEVTIYGYGTYTVYFLVSVYGFST